MPAAIIGPLIGAGVSAGAGIIGASQAAGAAKSAAATQSTSADKAMAVGQQQYQQAQQNFAPYMQAGAQAASTLGSLLRPGGMGAAPSQDSLGWGGRPATPPPGGTVMIEAPDGTRKAVPSSQAQSFIKRGGKVVPPDPMQAAAPGRPAGQSMGAGLAQ